MCSCVCHGVYDCVYVYVYVYVYECVATGFSWKISLRFSPSNRILVTSKSVWSRGTKENVVLNVYPVPCSNIPFGVRVSVFVSTRVNGI